MSPEQLLGESPNVQWDLWALAVVVYEALTGQLPFAGDSPDSWRRAILSGRFTPLDRHLANARSPWQAFFTKSFDTDRTKRPISAAEFLRESERALSFQ